MALLAEDERATSSECSDPYIIDPQVWDRAKSPDLLVVVSTGCEGTGECRCQPNDPKIEGCCIEKSEKTEIGKYER